jgi:hypothetical protein
MSSFEETGGLGDCDLNKLIWCNGVIREDIECMAKLTSKTRKKIPAKEFGLPGERKYPMPDKSHAANAKARATQMVKKGKLSPASKAKIDAKANKVLGKSTKKTKGK